MSPSPLLPYHSTSKECAVEWTRRGGAVSLLVRMETTVQQTGTLTTAPIADRPLATWLSGRRFMWLRRAGQCATDAGLVWLAFMLAHFLRYELQVGGEIMFWNDEPFATFYKPAALYLGLSIFVFGVRGVYTLPRSASFLDEATLVIGGLITAMAGVVLAAYFLGFFPSRLTFLYAWIAALIFLIAKRGMLRHARKWLWERGIGVDRVLVVGSGSAGQRVMQAMLGQPSLGCKLVGFVDDGSEDRVTVATETGVAQAVRLGSPEEVGELVGIQGIDEVIIALPAAEAERVFRIVDSCRERDVTFKVVPDLYQLSFDRVDLAEIAGVPLIGFKGPSISGWNYGVKRIIDIGIASVILAIGLVPMAIVAVAIRRDSPGPILLRQPRIGRNGIEFEVIKFRTMVADAAEQRAELMRQAECIDPRLFKLTDDPRRTKVGRVLRRWSLDELPQFWHVLTGDMSVVGPRPQLPEEVAAYEDWHRQRLLVTPGLTGLWQVNGRSNLTFDEMVRLDLYYAEHWSPWLDTKVMLRTIPAVLTGRGAY